MDEGSLIFIYTTLEGITMDLVISPQPNNQK